jgi:hypothetical protein
MWSEGTRQQLRRRFVGKNSVVKRFRPREKETIPLMREQARFAVKAALKEENRLEAMYISVCFYETKPNFSGTFP